MTGVTRRTSNDGVVRVRPAEPSDREFLEAMLLEAFNWNPEREPATLSTARGLPEVWHYVAEWQRPNDFGVIATNDAGEPAGASWARFFSTSDPGYGFVDETIPEITMGVGAEHRNRGVGRALLDALVTEARTRAVPALSLSVEDGNGAARRLYERAGFTVVGREGDSDVMVLRVGEVRPEQLQHPEPPQRPEQPQQS
ncbi:N-acetyltransferase family protein [Humidisolicoccus flavus]|uniref:GNAT family N-acetyltransferase n=1 Tax=Humidisolicoccus flavus TaxID=3111414 RepID=UPI00324A882C